MEHARIDQVARTIASRRASLGLLVGLGLGVLGLNAEDASAKKRNKKRSNKKRRQPKPDLGQNPSPTPGQDPGPVPPTEQCRDLGAICVANQPGSCCSGLACDHSSAGTVCCKPEGTTCTSGTGCCSGSCDFLVHGGTCSPCRGRSCSATQPCCGGATCTNGFCGGCRDRAVSCTSSSQGCFSDCTSGACLSALGGRCSRDVDCKSCYLNQNCTNACVNGVCAL